MARIRTIKPEHTLSEKIGHLSDRAYRVWIALICNADDEGRGPLRVEELRAKIYAYQPKITAPQVSTAIQELSEANLIVTFGAEEEGKTFYEMHDWLDHQKIQHPTPSKLPSPPQNRAKPSVSGGLMRAHENLCDLTNSHPDLTQPNQGSRIKDQGSKPPIVPQKSGDVSVQHDPAPAESEPPQKKARERYSEGFLRFCKIHPWGSESEAKAWEIWQRKKLEAHANEICLATETQKAWVHKAREGFEYFPRMPSYLRNERWKDKPRSPQYQQAGRKSAAQIFDEMDQEDEGHHGNENGDPGVITLADHEFSRVGERTSGGQLQGHTPRVRTDARGH